MDPIKELQGLKRDTSLLWRNVLEKDAIRGSVFFHDHILAQQQIRRILGRTWALKGSKNWAVANDAAMQLLIFATNTWAVLGNYDTEEWPWYHQHVKGQCTILKEWAKKRLEKRHPSPSSLS